MFVHHFPPRVPEGYRNTRREGRDLNPSHVGRHTVSVVSPARRRPRASQVAPNAARLQAAARVTVARRLAELLSQRPRSLAQLSEEAGLGESTIGRISRGAVEPSLSEMVALATVFDLGSIEALISPLGTRTLLDAASEARVSDSATGT